MPRISTRPLNIYIPIVELGDSVNDFLHNQLGAAWVSQSLKQSVNVVLIADEARFGRLQSNNQKLHALLKKWIPLLCRDNMASCQFYLVSYRGSEDELSLPSWSLPCGFMANGHCQSGLRHHPHIMPYYHESEKMVISSQSWLSSLYCSEHFRHVVIDSDLLINDPSIISDFQTMQRRVARQTGVDTMMRSKPVGLCCYASGLWRKPPKAMTAKQLAARHSLDEKQSRSQWHAGKKTLEEHLLPRVEEKMEGKKNF